MPMDALEIARESARIMWNEDNATRHVGMELVSVEPGKARLSLKVRDEFTNGHGMCHGGYIFMLADSAFAFACNNRNILSVALDTAINFIKPVHVGDVLTAEAREIHNGKSTGLYHIHISNQNNHEVAIFKGTCFRTHKSLL